MIVLKKEKDTEPITLHKIHVIIYNIKSLSNYIYSRILEIEKLRSKIEVLPDEPDIRRELIYRLRRSNVLPICTGIITINDNNITRSIRNIVGGNLNVEYYYKDHDGMLIFVSNYVKDLF